MNGDSNHDGPQFHRDQQLMKGRGGAQQQGQKANGQMEVVGQHVEPLHRAESGTSLSGSASGDGLGGASSSSAFPGEIGELPRFNFRKMAEVFRASSGDARADAERRESLLLSILRHCTSPFESISTRRAFLHAVCAFDVIPSFQAAGDKHSIGLYESETTIAFLSVLACEA